MSSNRVDSAESELKEANSLFVDENYEEALKHYSLSIELDNTNGEAFLKRSTCYSKLQQLPEAVGDANMAIKLQPTNSKAYLRKGMACFAMEEYETAKTSFEKGQQIDPQNTSFKTWIRKCVAEIETEQDNEKPSKKEETTKDSQEPSVVSNTPTQTIPAQVVIKPSFRHEWYQSASHVTVNIFAKNTKKEDTNIDLQEKALFVTIKISDSNEYHLDLNLRDNIVPSESSISFLSTKIEIIMKKTRQGQWKTLEDTGEAPAQVVPTATPTSAIRPKKNWDKIVEDNTKGEQLDNTDPLNKVFQDIFANGSEDQKRAMMKSYLESGGTVLSTNWDDVGKGPVKGSPPDGMEMHKWGEE